MKKIIAPSILSANFENLKQDLQACEDAGADWIHVDVMDGHFVPNISFGPLIVGACKRSTSLPLDVHLMVKDPDSMIDEFARAGADRLTVHQEACIHLDRTIQHIHAHHLKAGVSLNPSTPVNFLDEILDELDLVLIMTVNPGFGGQTFIPNSLKKISQLRQEIDRRGLATWLEVDGGISETTLPAVLKAGANAFVAGNAIFKHPAGIAGAISGFKSLF
jgi:ribulose-phosphate 3-epimerase